MSLREPETVAADTAPVLVAPEPPLTRPSGFPWLAVVALWGAAGIALLSASFALARANADLDLARFLFWGALTAIGAPALVRMLAPSTPRTERILIVALTALLLYWIKVLHDPVRLFFPDEFHHLTNTQRLAATGELYAENLLLPVSAVYPALPTVTAALSDLSGLGLFPCALIVIGLAKVMLVVALFFIFERVSGSARIAGVGALLYCANANYVFFSSQFGYESLSLPLMVVVLLCVVARIGAPRAQRMAWSAFGCLVAVAVAITHHLTAYAMAAVLWAQVAFALGLRRRRPDVRPPLAMAVVATVTIAAWAMLVAGGTGNYLGDIFNRLVRAVRQATSDAGAGTRAPFQTPADATGYYEVPVTPLDDQILAVAAALLVGLGVLGGILVARKRTWLDPLVLILGLAAVAAVAAYPLRVLPGGWEVSNRTSEFLFLGVGIIAAVAVVAFVDRGRRRRRVALIAAAGVVALAGGSVIGWPGAGRLPRPFTAQVDGGRIVAPGPHMTQWARANLPRDVGILANDTNGRLLSTAGFERVWTGPTPGVGPLLIFDFFPQWTWDFLREQRIGYVVLDRRVASRDNVIGYFYPRPAEADDPLIPYWLGVRRKYERLPNSNRIFDSGDIVVYDIRRSLADPKTPDDGSDRPDDG